MDQSSFEFNDSSSWSLQWNQLLNNEEYHFLQENPKAKKVLDTISHLLHYLQLNPDTITCHVVMAYTKEFKSFYLDSTSSGQEFYGTYVASRGICASIRNFIAASLSTAGRSTVLGGEFTDKWWVKQVCAKLRNLLWNLADGAASMRLALCQCGFISDLVLEIEAMTSYVNLTNNATLYDTDKDFFLTISTLHNSSRSPSCAAFFTEADALEACRPIRRAKSLEIRYLVFVMMANIISKDTDKVYVIADSHTFRWILQMLKACSEDHRRVAIRYDVRYHEFELVAGLESLTKIEENRRLPVALGAVPILLSVLRDGDEAARVHTCRTLRNLSETAHVRRDVAAAGAARVLRSTAGSEVSRDLRTAVTGALEVVEGPA